MNRKRKEWDDLSQNERNCLMWPDLLPWGKTRDVEVSRENSNSSLGLVTTVVQDPETKNYYHIAKRIKDNYPAHGLVKSFEWVCAVDGNLTTTEKGLKNLISNGRDIVCLSLRTVDDPLSSDRTWAMEKVFDLDIEEKKCGFELVHFYGKEENGNVKDRILIWDVKSDPPPKSSQRLFRGDELLEVNGEGVEGKRLAQIYKLIFAMIPSKVELKIKKIQQRVECTCEEPVVPSAPPQESQLVNSPDSTIPENQTERNSGLENRVEIEEHPSGERPPEGPQTPSSFYQDTEGLISEPQQEADNGGPSRRVGSIRNLRNKKKCERQPSISENYGYEGTPKSPRKTYPITASTDKMCPTCIKTGETRLPDDRNKWPMNKIEIARYGKMCKLLDLDERSKVKLLHALECFDQTEASSIQQKFSNEGGAGMAKFALDRWGNQDRTHNVGAFKEIVKNKMKRQDVLDEIEKWENLNVCHGCGIKLKENN